MRWRGSSNPQKQANPTEIPAPAKDAIQVERAALQGAAGCSEEQLHPPSTRVVRRTFLLVADRPANLVRSYAVNPDEGTLVPLTEFKVSQPAFVEFEVRGS